MEKEYEGMKNISYNELKKEITQCKELELYKFSYELERVIDAEILAIYQREYEFILFMAEFCNIDKIQFLCRETK